MWIFTESGFISAVQKGGPDVIMCRGRDRKSLEALARVVGRPRTDIYALTRSDYPWRIELSRAELQSFLTQAVADLDYSNFKDRITDTRGETWHHALMNVWTAMLAVTPRQKRRARTHSQHDRYLTELETVNAYPIDEAGWDALMREEPHH